jgi:hypothetical protein
VRNYTITQAVHQSAKKITPSVGYFSADSSKHKKAGDDDGQGLEEWFHFVTLGFSRNFPV